MERKDQASEEEAAKAGRQLDVGRAGGEEDPRFPFGGLDGWRSH